MAEANAKTEAAKQKQKEEEEKKKAEEEEKKKAEESANTMGDVATITALVDDVSADSDLSTSGDAGQEKASEVDDSLADVDGEIKA